MRAMKRFGLGLAAALLASGAWAQQGDGRVSYGDHLVVEVAPESREQLEKVLRVVETTWSERVGVGPIEVVADPGQIERLRALGLEPETVIDDLQARIEGERARLEAPRPQGASFYEEFQPFGEVIARVDQLVQAHPDLAERSVIGQSVEGRDIVAVDVTGPGDASERPVLVFNGCQHAREWISPSVVMYIMESLLEGYGDDPRITRILDSAVVKIVPVVNPDGYVYSWQSDRLWRKNRRDNGFGSYGVDLNRNWDWNFGGEGASSFPPSGTYHGPSAFSEPETAAVRDYILNDPNTVAHIDFHSFSQLVLHPWGHDDVQPPEPDFSFFQAFTDEMSAIIESVAGQFYVPQQAIDLYPAAGTMSDWTYSVGLKGWTIELRPSEGAEDGFILPPDQILPTARENLPVVLAMGERFALPLRFPAPDRLPRVLDADEATSFEVEIAEGVSELEPGTAVLRYSLDVSEGFTTVPLAKAGDGVFEATLPALGCGRRLEYAIEAESVSGRTVSLPAGEPITARSAIEASVFADDMESDRGWSVGAPGDDATTGIWERADPQGTDAQPEDDNTPGGTQAWVTGAARNGGLGGNDVDGGRTTLLSPVLDATPPADWHEAESVVRYARWYSNNTGNAPNDDPMSVEVSTDGGSAWSELEEVRDNFGAWTTRAFVLADVVAPTDQTRVRFVARDEEPGSIVEAGVDDFELVTRGCRFAPADLDESGSVTSADFLAYLDLFAAEDPDADMTADGAIDSSDFLAFLTLFSGV